MVTQSGTAKGNDRGRLYGLIGYPLGHSFSQRYFTDKFEREREKGLECNDEYRLFPLADLGEFESLLAEYPVLAGLNVTIPYKERIIPYLDDLSDEARRIGAVNVIRIERDDEGRILRLTGHNSDCYGFRESLLPLLRPDVVSALVLGTGGASKAVAYVLKRLGMEVTMVSRSPEEGEIGYTDLTEDVIGRNLLIVNCTPLGTYPNVNAAPAIPYSLLTPRHICYDLVYNPGVTEFMRRSAEQGATVKNGLDMLHLQADRGLADLARISNSVMNPLSSPVFLPLVALVAGIVCVGFGAGVWTGSVAIITGSVFYLWLLSLRRNPAKLYRFSRYHQVWIALVFTGIGIMITDLTRPYVPSEDAVHRNGYMTGRVCDLSSRTSGDRMTVEIESLVDSSGTMHDSRRFLVLVRTESAECGIDDVVLMPTSLERIKDSENSFFGGYAENMARKGIYYMQTTPSDRISVVGHRVTLSGLAVSMRDQAVQFIEKRHLDRQTVSFLVTVLLGDRAYLDEDSRTLFADAGLAHILALSGMHIGIIAGIILFLLFPMNFYGRYRLRLMVGLLALWLYTFVTGMAPSTVRACIMVSFMTVGIFLERKGNNFNALCLAALVILVFSPHALWDVGFQLSFLGVASLIAFANHFNPIGMRRHPRLRNAAGLVLASLVTTFATWTLVAYYFGRFPLMFLVGNLLVVPLLPFYVSGALVYFFFEAIGVDIPFMEYLLDYGLEMLYNAVRAVSGDSTYVLDLSVGLPTVWLWLAGACALAVKLNFPEVRRVGRLSAVLFAGALICVPFAGKASPDGFIICSTSRNVEFRVKQGKRELSVKVPTGTVAGYEIHGKTILACDTDPGDVHPDSVVENPDYLVLTRSCKAGIAELDSIFRPAMFVIHPSVRKDREQLLMAEADSIGARVHSLRGGKALRIEIP